MSASDRQPGAVQDYLAVLDAADAAVEVLGRLEQHALGHEMRDWATHRREAGEVEAAMLSAAAASGRLADYEAAVRALVSERVPLDDAPPTLREEAATAAGQLDRLAGLFRSTISDDLPAPDAVSVALRAADRARGSRTFAPLSTLEVERPLQRAAASSPAVQGRAEWASETGARRLTVQHGEQYVELWVEDDDPVGPPLAPIALALSDVDDRQVLFALLVTVTSPATRLGYLRVRHDDHRVVVELGESLRFDELQPRDAPAVLASIAASGRSWREGWQSASREIPWLRVVAAQANIGHGRD